MGFVRDYPVEDLHTLLSFQEKLQYSLDSMKKPLWLWRMEIDDAPIFRYLYRNLKPERHLEFGTWQGSGATYCLEESKAIVWTLNLPFGEMLSDGTGAYFFYEDQADSLAKWARKIGVQIEDETEDAKAGLIERLGISKKKRKLKKVRTDTLGFIGREYLEKGFGHRVCQIYCDSREWDISKYPSGFFDSALIDGGHSKAIVKSDTEKALKLVRAGGIILWHDYCPDTEVLKRCESPRGVVSYIQESEEKWMEQMDFMFWIKPSWILIGRKKSNTGTSK